MKIYVIGGGAAGIMAAIYASDEDTEVTILEKNEKIAKKLFITGKGRCNITNTADYEEYFNNIVSNKNFLRGALRLMPPDSVIKLLNDNGLMTKVERGKRVFPKSDKSSDVIKTFEKILQQKNVKIIFNETVTGFVVKDKLIKKIITKNNEYTPDRVILATGGKSYKATGSNGSGYKLAEKLGHTIVPLRPGLIPIITKYCFDAYKNKLDLQNMPSLQGLSLKNVECKILNLNQKTLFKEFGEMLFTHNGLSGPIILTLSSKINRMDFKDLRLSVDLKPAVDEKTLDNRLIREFESKSNKNFKNSLN
ncbi:MAG: aminoacetone oxidase family FAD-binding enzyme, partial [Bacillota bacterium]